MQINMEEHQWNHVFGVLLEPLLKKKVIINYYYTYCYYYYTYYYTYCWFVIIIFTDFKLQCNSYFIGMGACKNITIDSDNYVYQLVDTSSTFYSNGVDFDRETVPYTGRS